MINEALLPSRWGFDHLKRQCNVTVASAHSSSSSSRGARQMNIPLSKLSSFKVQQSLPSHLLCQRCDTWFSSSIVVRLKKESLVFIAYWQWSDLNRDSSYRTTTVQNWYLHFEHSFYDCQLQTKMGIFSNVTVTMVTYQFHISHDAAPWWMLKKS